MDESLKEGELLHVTDVISKIYYSPVKVTQEYLLKGIQRKVSDQLKSQFNSSIEDLTVCGFDPPALPTKTEVLHTRAIGSSLYTVTHLSAIHQAAQHDIIFEAFVCT